MSRDFDNIMKEINKSHKELYSADHKIAKEIVDIHKNISSINKEISNLKKDIKNIDSKIDNVLEILNTLIVFIEESSDDLPLEEEDTEDGYESNEGWIKDIDSWKDEYDDNSNEEEN